MTIIVRRVAALPALAAVWLLAGCTGADPGKANPDAAAGYADKFGNFLIENGKAVAVFIVIIAVIGFLNFMLRSPQLKILFALVVGIALAYFALRGGR